ncbi:MAG: hypothetical protein ACMVY4_12155 [Minwuia sp.]|uniref:hypothetical protein n=1 Tax=Minwuia sp. TaxID=2493630 RepID=UPI003A83D583
MAADLFSIGFRGVFAAWIARRTALMGIGGVWVTGGQDIVTSRGHPTTGDLLYPARPAPKGQRADADLAAEIERLAPHLIRPVRLVNLDTSKPGLLKRLMGASEDPGEPVNLEGHQAGRPLVIDKMPARIERCVFIDRQRLTVALARDFVARGGTIQPEGPKDAAYNLTDDQQDADRFEPRAAFIVRRPYREEYAYRFRCDDGEPAIALPLDQDMLLVERTVGNGDPEDAFRALMVGYHFWFAQEPDDDDLIDSVYYDDGRDYSCIQHLRQDDRFLDRFGKIISQYGVGSNPDTAGLIDGLIEENYGQFANKLAANYSHLDAAYIRGLVARHGPLAPDVLGECHRDADLGEDFGGGLRAREARWIRDNEFPRMAQDIAGRRGPFALKGADVDALQAWMDRGAPVG